MNCIAAPMNSKNFHLLNEHIRDPKYKTEMCKNWEKNGTCPYNSKCRFAHGREELMNKEAEANPNYKAKDCLNFFKFGFCSYGRRCCFKHDERKLNEANLEADFKILISLSKPAQKSRLSAFRSITEPRVSKVFSSSVSLSSAKESDKVNSLDSTQEEIVYQDTECSES
mmetsp:Transcript_3065/g.3121  ORF Transcript_3065/g.3121 Transcript_3065/m.3121 type:complete len:169 (+) Transcript_3065:36-542(+)